MLIKYADVLAEGLDELTKLSGVGLAVSAMKAAATAQRQASAWIQRRAEPWLQHSQSLSEEQLLAELPLQWAKDFRQALSSHPGEDWKEAASTSQDWDDVTIYSGPPPLIVLDTYETLWHRGMGRSGRRREPREKWLVDLVSELPEVLWLIGGRDQLSWEEGYDMSWSKVCEQHLVGQLSDEDARLLLAKRGINEPAIVEKIVSQAEGGPFYLELETQLYDKTPPAERTPEVFGGSHQTLIDRLLTHLDASERATVKLLSAFGIWDHNLFRQAVTHFATGYPATGAAELGRFWSIEPIGESRWQLHNEMAYHLQADERQRNPASFAAVHRWGFAFFDGPLEGLEAKAIQAEDAERLERALHHSCRVQPAGEWAPWLAGRLWKMAEGTIWQPLLAVAERGVEEAQRELGEANPAVAELFTAKACLLHKLARYGEAEPLMRRALEIAETSYGPNHPDVARDLNTLATLLKATNRLAEAEQLMVRALVINQASYGPEHPNVATALNNLAMLMRATHRLEEAEPLMRRALAIDQASFGNDHPSIGMDLNNLAMLLMATTRLAEAELLMRQALVMYEASHGSEHPIVATALNNLAALMHGTSRLAEAEQLMRRALAIDEANYGPNHPEVAFDLNNLGQLLQATHGLAEAELLSARAVRIFLAGLGGDHPRTKNAKDNYRKLLEAQGLPEAEIQAKLEALHPLA
ncbi:MAG: tetratricopeptide repeat protein [Cyanobacteriota bacterium]